MKLLKIGIWVVLIWGIAACTNVETQAVKSRLRRLSDAEVVQRRLQGELYYYYADFVDEYNKPIPRRLTHRINVQRDIRDYYVDGEGVIRRVKVRPRRREDIFRNLLINNLRHASLPAVDSIVVDCSQLKRTIVNWEKALPEALDEPLDTHVVQQMDALIQRCGLPTRGEVGEKGMDTLVEVLLRSGGRRDLLYYYVLVDGAERGDITPIEWAQCQDRILARYGRPQWYGTWSHRPKIKIANMDSVQLWRARVGLPPLDTTIVYEAGPMQHLPGS